MDLDHSNSNLLEVGSKVSVLLQAKVEVSLN
jgi:hypothetical protein